MGDRPNWQERLLASLPLDERERLLKEWAMAKSDMDLEAARMQAADKSWVGYEGLHRRAYDAAVRNGDDSDLLDEARHNAEQAEQVFDRRKAAYDAAKDKMLDVERHIIHHGALVSWPKAIRAASIAIGGLTLASLSLLLSAAKVNVEAAHWGIWGVVAGLAFHLPATLAAGWDFLRWSFRKRSGTPSPRLWVLWLESAALVFQVLAAVFVAIAVFGLVQGLTDSPAPAGGR